MKKKKMVTKNFSAEELVCPCCNRMRMAKGFLEKLEFIRQNSGFPFPVTSGYRCSAHNTEVSTTGMGGPHTTGHAVDIAIYGSEALHVIDWAIKMGMIGIGLKQHGPHAGRFIHIDDLEQPAHTPRPWIWTYA